MDFPHAKISEHGVFHRSEGDSASTRIFIGKSRSGKSTFLVDQINKLAGLEKTVEGGIRRPMYDFIIIFSESLESKPLQSLSRNLDNVVLLSRYLPKVPLLLKRLNDVSGNRFNFLLVLDDCLGSSGGKSLRAGNFSRLMLVFRNSNISTVVCIQSAKMLDPSSRESTHYLFSFGMKTKDAKRVVNELIFDSALKHVGGLKEGGRSKTSDEISREFFEKVGSNILLYDNLANESSIIPRLDFKK